MLNAFVKGKAGTSGWFPALPVHNQTNTNPSSFILPLWSVTTKIHEGIIVSKHEEKGPYQIFSNFK